MALIDSLRLGFTVSTGGLSSGLGKAQGLLSGFKNVATSAGTSLVGFGAAAIGAATAALSVGKAISEVANQFEEIDALAKTSNELGIAADKLVSLRFGADLAGIGAEQLDKSLEKLSKNISEAGQGAGGAKDAFKALGLDIQKLSQLPVEEQLGQIADGLNQIKSPADRVSLSMDILGKQGGKMLNFLALGSKGFAETEAQAKKLGISLTNIDASMIEQANDNISILKTLFTGLARQAAIQLSPSIIAVTQNLIDMGSAGIDASSNVRTAFDSVAKTIGLVADVVDVLHDGFLALQALVTKLIAGQINQWAMVYKAIQTVVNLLPGVEATFANSMEAMGKDLDKLAGQQWEDAKTAFMAPPPSEGISNWLKKVDADARQVAANMSSMGGDKTLVDSFVKTNEPAMELIEKLKEELQTLNLGADAAELFKLKQQGVSDALISQIAALQQQKTAVEGWTKSQEDAAQKIKEAHEQLAQSAKQTWEQTRTPIEQYKTRLQELQNQFARGLIDSDTFQRGQLAAIPDDIKQIKDRSKSEIQQFRNELEKLNQFKMAGLISDKDFRLAALEKLPQTVKDLVEKSKTPFDQFKLKLKELQDLKQAGLINDQQFKLGVDESLPEKVKDIIAKSKTPLQKFAEQFKELQTFKVQGLIDDRQFKLAAADLQKETFGQPQEVKFAKIAEFGSQDARESILRHEVGTVDPVKQLEQGQLTELQRQTALLQRIAAPTPAPQQMQMPQLPQPPMPQLQMPRMPQPQFNLPQLPPMPQPRFGIPEPMIVNRFNMPQMPMPPQPNIINRVPSPQTPNVQVQIDTSLDRMLAVQQKQLLAQERLVALNERQFNKKSEVVRF